MTASWGTAGIPLIAQQRLERARTSRLATSLLSASGAAAIEMANLDVVGEVFGAAVVHLGWVGYGQCGYSSQYFGGFTGGYAAQGMSGFQPYVTATRQAYASALDRMAIEATALGSDGVVGLRIGVAPMGNENYEFTALGTAVRFGTRPVPPRPLFRTELSAVDLLSLLKAGWLPVDVLFGIGVEIVHDDWTQRMQTSSYSNVEVTSLTSLMSGARDQARKALHTEATRAHAAGVLMTGRQERVWEQEPNEGHRDHVAEVRISGTGIVPFGTPTHRPPAIVLPVRP